MSVTWNIDGSTLSLRLDGTYDFQEVIAAIRAAFSDSRFRPGVSLLLDERTSEANPSATEKRARVVWISSLRPDIAGRVALVTSTQPVRYGLARMASVYFELEGFEAKVFTEIEPAHGWLASFPASPFVSNAAAR